MRWRMVLEVVGVEGVAGMHEIGAGERPPGGHSAATLGLVLEILSRRRWTSTAAVVAGATDAGRSAR